MSSSDSDAMSTGRLAAEALTEFKGLLTTYLARNGEPPPDRSAVEEDADEGSCLLIALDGDALDYGGADGILVIDTREEEE